MNSNVKQKGTSEQWGKIQIGNIRSSSKLSIRRLINSEITETREFSERLYRDFNRYGRRKLATRLVKAKDNKKWPCSP